MAIVSAPSCDRLISIARVGHMYIYPLTAVIPFAPSPPGPVDTSFSPRSFTAPLMRPLASRCSLNRSSIARAAEASSSAAAPIRNVISSGGIVHLCLCTIHVPLFFETPRMLDSDA